METKLKVEGKCCYCKESFARTGISKHLESHLKQKEAEQKTTQTAFHLRVNAAEMFLNLLVSGDALLTDLDMFLREIWLECCGHMSSFTVPNKKYDFSFDEEGETGESMESTIATLFGAHPTLQYDYDFGSTTTLEIKLLKSYSIACSNAITLLSRNEPLPLMCATCKTKPATKICSVHMYEGYSLYCASCGKKHAKTCEDFEDYAGMKLVNSPRMGVCAYEGGAIDKARDGAYKLPKTTG